MWVEEKKKSIVLTSKWICKSLNVKKLKRLELEGDLLLKETN